MTRYFVGAILAIAIVTALGYVVRDRLFGSAPPQAVSTPSRAIAIDAAVSDRQITVAIVDLEGRVEKRVGEHWIAVSAGDTLSAQDTIRTSDGSHAHIKTGDQVVELGDRSEITVGDISSSVSAYLLGEGRVSANAGGGGRKIRIETRGTDAVAETESGRFDVTSTGTGHVAVASEAGSVQVTAHGKSVDVPAGTQTFVTAGSAPSAPTKIPASLFLKVSAAGGGRDRSAALRGETAPGAIVSINGVRSAADDHGRFDSKVALKSGDNVIVVLVEDATGRSRKQLIKKSFDSAGPKVTTEVDWK